jgi:hypothetical protein
MTFYRSKNKALIPLQHVSINKTFKQWGINIIREINPHLLRQHKYILTATNYFTQWIEAMSLTQVNEKVITQFFKQYLITGFGVLSVIMLSNAL